MVGLRSDKEWGWRRSQEWIETPSSHLIMWVSKGMLYSDGLRYPRGLEDGRRGIPPMDGK
jgi:hypothetical protein